MATPETLLDDLRLKRAREFAARAEMTVEAWMASVVARHIDMMEMADDITLMPPFSPQDYVMLRAPGESDNDYEARRNAFGGIP